jgi:hypothetical protein
VSLCKCWTIEKEKKCNIRFNTDLHYLRLFNVTTKIVFIKELWSSPQKWKKY